jgi:ABC-2 type transport system permease protein
MILLNFRLFSAIMNKQILMNKTHFNLIRELAFTDFKLKYQGSVLGYLWSLVKPLMLFLVLYVVFTRVFRLGDSIPHYPVYLLLGVVVWGFFTEMTAVSLGAIVGKGDLIRKVYFPRIVLVISGGITSLITFLLNLIIVFLFIIFTHAEFSLKAPLFILLIIELFVLAIGVSLILSSLFVRFRDLSHIWEIILQAMFYATPILYPLSLVPSPFNKIIMLNPAAQIIQDMRYLLVTQQTETGWMIMRPMFYIIPYILPFVILIFGYFLFEKSAAKFAEEV